MKWKLAVAIALLVGVNRLPAAHPARADEEAALPKACIDGTGPGWRELGWR